MIDARSIALTLLALLIASCGGAPTVPADNFYRLTVSPPSSEPSPLLAGTVLVRPLTGAGLLRERPILFTTAGQLHQMRQHDYHYWNESPPRMIQAALVGYLGTGGVAKNVVTPELRVPAGFEIVGSVKRLEQVVASRNRVIIELELAIISADSAELLLSQTYRAEQDADSGIEAAVLALEEALANVFGEFVDDVRNLGQRTLEAGR